MYLYSMNTGNSRSHRLLNKNLSPSFKIYHYKLLMKEEPDISKIIEASDIALGCLSRWLYSLWQHIY